MAPHILAISFVLSIIWGIYLVYVIREFVRSKGRADRRKTDKVVAFRRMIVGICVFLLPFSFVFRTASVLIGISGDQINQITFFALLGANLVGSLYAAGSAIDDWRDQVREKRNGRRRFGS